MPIKVFEIPFSGAGGSSGILADSQKFGATGSKATLLRATLNSRGGPAEMQSPPTSQGYNFVSPQKKSMPEQQSTPG